MATPVQGSRQSPEEVPFGSVLAVSVRARRERAGLSQGELAKLAGLSAGTLSVVEAGTGNPTVSTLLALSKVLGCDVTDLLRDATDPMIRLLRHSDPAPPGGSISKSRLLHQFAPNGPVEFYEAELPAGSRNASSPHAPGVYEHIWLARGTLTTGPEGAVERLEPGDYFCFQGWVPHSYEAGPDGATFLSALSYTRSLWATRELLGHKP
ncbi:transcriptional regulator, XRE family with cupin sensor [Actinomadura glauciflava]|uniref:Transcriptional regulator with XRE-family HTH domain n=1 Tax=Actinomadura luteofluorescens TaxID=46163 RepID=A0A7Y9JDL7_9ACTN|nr:MULTISPECIES: XRE family transcriptional regulator [Actinomadura]MCR3740462.1 transcriptional regulator, XRE family with cupin sensor [Actinomadura glauciflava]NYD44633.1 transcriptional regulator with XRE-family HTH domain [Actinomadura luteofluorescens]